MKFFTNTISLVGALVGALTLVAFIPLNANAKASDPHVHGEAQVEIAIDGQILQIGLTSPLESLVGFEHAPRTAAQKGAMHDMMQAFRQPEQLFAPTAGAQCKAEPAVVSAPTAKGPGGNERDHAAGGAADHAAHAELEATITFRCLAPTALRSIEFKLFDVFRGMRHIDVQVVGPKGQTAATLTPKQQSLSW